MPPTIALQPSPISALFLIRPVGWRSGCPVDCWLVPFVCVKTCTSKPKTDGGFNFARCYASSARDSGRVVPGMATTPNNLLRFEGRKIQGGELALVTTNIPAPKNALRLYRQRWRIGCLFADAKTRRFNIEVAHMTNPAKLATLLVMVVLAMTWAYRCVSRAMGRQRIPKKSHKRCE